MTTILLDNNTWDLVADAAGNIAVADSPYSLAQDVASACRLFLAELWYDSTKGVPYNEEILGKLPTEDALRQFLIDAALTVETVVSADVQINSFDGRSLSGILTFTDSLGGTFNVGI